MDGVAGAGDGWLKLSGVDVIARGEVSRLILLTQFRHRGCKDKHKESSSPSAEASRFCTIFEVIGQMIVQNKCNR